MAKNGPKNTSNVRKWKKNEPNSQVIPVFWFVTEAIHEVRGISPYGDRWGFLEMTKMLVVVVIVTTFKLNDLWYSSSLTHRTHENYMRFIIFMKRASIWVHPQFSSSNFLGVMLKWMKELINSGISVNNSSQHRLRLCHGGLRTLPFPPLLSQITFLLMRKKTLLAYCMGGASWKGHRASWEGLGGGTQKREIERENK